jgi:hypothetical protein
MFHYGKLLFVPVVAATLAMPNIASARADTVNCSVAVNVTGAPAPDIYNQDFELAPGAAFKADLSTPTRQKTFDAVVVREADGLVVSISYFNDISTFDSVSFSTRLTLPSGRGIGTTAGANSFSTSLPNFRSYTTNYTLTCRRAPSAGGF